MPTRWWICARVCSTRRRVWTPTPWRVTSGRWCIATPNNTRLRAISEGTLTYVNAESQRYGTDQPRGTTSLKLAYSHAHAHTYTYMRMHTPTPTCACTHIHMYTHSHTLSLTRSDLRKAHPSHPWLKQYDAMNAAFKEACSKWLFTRQGSVYEMG